MTQKRDMRQALDIIESDNAKTFTRAKTLLTNQ